MDPAQKAGAEVQKRDPITDTHTWIYSMHVQMIEVRYLYIYTDTIMYISMISWNHEFHDSWNAIEIPKKEDAVLLE